MHARSGSAGGAPGSEELLRIDEAARRLAVGRTTIYDLIGAHKLKSVKVGRSRRVLAESVREYARQLADEA